MKLFVLQPVARQAWADNSNQSAHSNVSRDNGSQSAHSNVSHDTPKPSPDVRHKPGVRGHIPTEPRQVTREHLSLTAEQISKLGSGGEEERGEHTGQEIRRR